MNKGRINTQIEKLRRSLIQDSGINLDAFKKHSKILMRIKKLNDEQI